MNMLGRLLVRIFPTLENHKRFKLFKNTVYVSILPLLAIVIVPAIQLQLVSNQVIAKRDIKVLKITITYQCIYSFVPWVASLILAPIVFKGNKYRGNPRIMWTMVFFNATLLTFEQCFRAAQSFRKDLSWLLSKPTFYCVIFVPEILVVASNLINRFHRRFWHPYGQAIADMHALPALDEKYPSDGIEGS